MTFTSDEAPRRRPRFTLRRAMLALPVAALIIVLVVGIDPFRGDPMRRAIAEATEWCCAPTAMFDAPIDFRRPPGAPAPSSGRPAAVAKPCVLKVVRVGDVVWDRRIVRAFGTDVALAEDGQLQQSRRTPMAGWPARQSSIPPDGMATIALILPTLPPSTSAEIPPGPTIETHLSSSNHAQQMTESRALVLGFRDGEAWVTRVYDRTRLPPAVGRLLGQLGFDPDLP